MIFEFNIFSSINKNINMYKISIVILLFFVALLAIIVRQIDPYHQKLFDSILSYNVYCKQNKPQYLILIYKFVIQWFSEEGKINF